MNRRRNQTGTMSLELVVLTPVLLGCVLTIAGGARIVDASSQVDGAAHAAARAASLQSTQAAAATAGQDAARRWLTDRGLACATMEVHVDTTDFGSGGAVSARITCTADLSDLAGFGLPGQRQFVSEAVAPLEEHRAFS